MHRSLYDFESPSDLWFFLKMTSQAFFQGVGKIPCSRHLLSTLDTASALFLTRSFTTFSGISSGPGALFYEMARATSLTVSSDITFVGSVPCHSSWTLRPCVGNRLLTMRSILPGVFSSGACRFTPNLPITNL